MDLEEHAILAAAIAAMSEFASQGEIVGALNFAHNTSGLFNVLLYQEIEYLQADLD